MTEFQNPKHAQNIGNEHINLIDLKEQTSTFGSLDIGICNLFVICLPAVFLAGCLCIGFLSWSV